MANFALTECGDHVGFSIPKRVSEVLWQIFVLVFRTWISFSIPKRVSEVLWLERNAILF